jgi:uncharacterized membrane protein YdbT with pleckstrin-like domain
MANHLLPDEKLVLKVHRHWILLARALVVPAIMLLLAAGVGVAGASLGDARPLLALLLLAVAGLWMIVAWVRWSATSLTLTDQRVLLESGILSRVSKVIALDRVQDVSTQESLLGRLIGYGTVEIDAAGASGNEILDHVPQPHELRDKVFLNAERLRRASAL